MTSMTQYPTTEERSRATVLGLGPMGSALARALLSAGVETTVWNRTRARADALAGDGARVAESLVDAISAAELVVTCLRDHAATREVLAAVPADELAGRTVVVLASSTPDEARETHAWAESRGITVLLGAIMVPTSVIGTPDAQILYSGNSTHVEKHRDLLELLAGRTEHVGDDPGLASLLDTTMLEVFFASMTAFLHASAVLTAQGQTAASFVARAQDVLALLPATFAGLAADVDAGRYPGDEDTITMELAALHHMVATSAGSGVDTRLPALMRDLARSAVDAGHGSDGWSRVVEVLRAPAGRP